MAEMSMATKLPGIVGRPEGACIAAVALVVSAIGLLSLVVLSKDDHEAR